MEKESNNRFEKIEKLLIFFAYEIKRNTRHFFFFFFTRYWILVSWNLVYKEYHSRPFLKVPFSRERCKRKWKISIGGGRDLRVIRATQSRSRGARRIGASRDANATFLNIESRRLAHSRRFDSIPLPLPFFLFIRSFVIIIINIRPRSPRSVDRGREWCVCRYCRIRSARTKSLGIYNSFPSLYCITRG